MARSEGVRMLDRQNVSTTHGQHERDEYLELDAHKFVHIVHNDHGWLMPVRLVMPVLQQRLDL